MSPDALTDTFGFLGFIHWSFTFTAQERDDKETQDDR